MSTVSVLSKEFADYTSPFCINTQNKTHSSNKKKVHADLRVNSTVLFILGVHVCVCAHACAHPCTV